MILLNETAKFEQLVKAIAPQGKLLRVWSLTGGVSAQVTGLEVEQSDGQVQKMIVRRHGENDLKRNPRIAEDEYRLLQILHRSGLAVPEPYYVEPFGRIFGTPCLVMEYLDGQTELAPADVTVYLSQLAAQLVSIHQVADAVQRPGFLPKMDAIYSNKLRDRPVNPDQSLGEERIRDVLEAVWPLRQVNASALLHGDFWPGNVLWRDGKIIGVIDWEDAALGDPLVDVANFRLEILWILGVDAMQYFTAQYQVLNALDFTNLPYWDLCVALRPMHHITEWAGGKGRERFMREMHRLFVQQALQALSLE